MLRSLPQQKLTLHYKENLPDAAAIKPVVGDLTANFSASGLRLTGSVKTLLKLECGRCLKPYFQSLSVDIDERFVQPDDYQLQPGEQKERELKSGDFVEPLPKSGELDIDEIIYQAVTLATPSYCLCDPGCNGVVAESESGKGGAGGKQGQIGAYSTHDQFVDPRWRNLKTLLGSEDNEENS